MMRYLAVAFALCSAFPAWAELNIQDVKSPGGFGAWLVEEPAIPFTALEIQFRGGASLDLPGKRGATALMTALLEEGAGDMDARAFARATEDLATSFQYDVSDDGLTVTARFLTENRDAALDLLRESLVEPRFDEDAIERVRRQLLSNLRSDAQDPRAIARKTFDALAYGLDHPYGSHYEGTETSVAALTRQDLIDAHRNVVTRNRVLIGAAGDMSADTLADVLDVLLGDLPVGEGALPDEITPQIAGGVTVVPYDTPQSVALFGHVGIERDDPDFFAAFILNQIMGAGGFESRLMSEVREKRGLTYGVYSYLAPKDYAATYQGGVSSANDRIAEAVDVIAQEWRNMAEQGITEEELVSAKRYLTGAYPLRFDGNANIASILVGMQAAALPIDYVATRNDKVNAVTLDEANTVASWLYKPDALHFVVVGMPEGLQDKPAN